MIWTIVATAALAVLLFDIYLRARLARAKREAPGRYAAAVESYDAADLSTLSPRSDHLVVCVMELSAGPADTESWRHWDELSEVQRSGVILFFLLQSANRLERWTLVRMLDGEQRAIARNNLDLIRNYETLRSQASASRRLHATQRDFEPVAG